MHNENDLLQEFNNAFGDQIKDYVLLEEGNNHYSIINVAEESIVILDDPEVAVFYINRFLELEVKIYSSFKDIPGWGTKVKEMPPEMHPILRDLIVKLSLKENK
jgi:hypothetical protein